MLNPTILYKNGNVNQAQTVREIVLDITDRCYDFTAKEVIHAARQFGITPKQLPNKKIYRILQGLAGTWDVVGTKHIPSKNRVQIKRVLWFTKTDTTYHYSWPKNITRYNYRRPENV